MSRWRVEYKARLPNLGGKPLGDGILAFADCLTSARGPFGRLLRASAARQPRELELGKAVEQIFPVATVRIPRATISNFRRA
eukprot:15500114-Heterocapsa_arctica.AAC.1